MICIEIPFEMKTESFNILKESGCELGFSMIYPNHKIYITFYDNFIFYSRTYYKPDNAILFGGPFEEFKTTIINKRLDKQIDSLRFL